MNKTLIYIPPFISGDFSFGLTRLSVQAECIPSGILITRLNLQGPATNHSLKRAFNKFEHEFLHGKYDTNIQYFVLHPHLSMFNISPEALKAIGFQLTPPDTRLYLPHVEGCLYQEVK